MGWSAIVWYAVCMYNTYLFCAGHDFFFVECLYDMVYVCDENNGKAVSQPMSSETENSSVAGGQILRKPQVTANDDRQIIPYLISTTKYCRLILLIF